MFLGGRNAPTDNLLSQDEDRKGGGRLPLAGKPSIARGLIEITAAEKRRLHQD